VPATCQGYACTSRAYVDARPRTARNTVDSPSSGIPNGVVNTPRAVVLVEGNSDRVALLTLAACRDRDLAAEGIEIVAMGGITNTRVFASRSSPTGRNAWASTAARRTWRTS